MNLKIVNIALCTLFLSLLFLLPASAQQKKQYKKVTLNIQNGTMEQIIQSVKKQTDLNIVYNHEILKDIPKLSFIAKNEDVKSVMKRLLKDADLVFELQGNVMVIGPKDELKDKETRIPIKGQVLDQDGKAIPSVTVNITGTLSNTISDQNGFFNIVIPEGKSLSFSYVGFQTKTQKPDPGKQMTVEMVPQQNDMEEFVVTGYQTINKRLSASSTFTLTAAEVKEAGATNITSMLQGKVPGLSVVQTSGSPNSVPKLRMRGTSTLVGNANPIIVVDGFVQENPEANNPDNVLGLNPSFRDQLLSKDGIVGKASLTGNSIAGLNVNDIETITFLKDASATAIYGTNAANGVIVITTKKGSIGKLSISYQMNTGLAQKPSYKGMDLMNSKQRVQFSREMYQDGLHYLQMPFDYGYEGTFLDLMNRKIDQTTFQNRVANLETINTNWFDVAFQNSINTKHHLSFNGGSEKIRVYSSVFYEDSKGSAKKDLQKRWGAMMNANMDISDKLRLDLKLDLSQRTSEGYFTVDPLQYALTTSRTLPSDQTYISSELRGPSNNDGTNQFWLYNLEKEIAETGNNLNSTVLNTIASLNYRPIESITMTSAFSANIADVNSEVYATDRSRYITNIRSYEYNSVVPGSSAQTSSLLPFGGLLTSSNTTVYNYNFRSTAQFAQRVFNDRDQIDVMTGVELRSIQDQGITNIIPGYLRDRGQSFALEPNTFYLLNPKKMNTARNYLSAFASAAYSIQDKYIINANLRSDASNRFGQYANRRFLPVWSISGRWNIAAEEWFKDSKIFNQLNVKASYGFQGNVIDQIGPDLLLSIPESFSAIHPLTKELIVNLKSMPYPDLRWEKTQSYNLELETSMFNSFIDLTVGYYHKHTSDAITRRDIPLEYGIPVMYVNGGNIQNRGYEFNVVLRPVRTEEINWTIRANAAKNFNSLSGKTDKANYTILDYLNGSVQTLSQPLNTFYVFSFKGLNPENGLPLFNGINRLENVPLSDFLRVAGSTDPDISGGLFTTVRYKAFSVGFSFSFSLGAKKLLNPLYHETFTDIPFADKNLPATFSSRWRKPGDEAHTNIPGFVSKTTTTSYGLKGYQTFSAYKMFDLSDQRLVSASFIRSRSIDLAYTIHNHWLSRLKIKGASVNASVNNLFTIADKKLGGQDPELPNVGSTALPITPIYSLGLNVSF